MPRRPDGSGPAVWSSWRWPRATLPCVAYRAPSGPRPTCAGPNNALTTNGEMRSRDPDRDPHRRRSPAARRPARVSQEIAGSGRGGRRGRRGRAARPDRPAGRGRDRPGRRTIRTATTGPPRRRPPTIEVLAERGHRRWARRSAQAAAADQLLFGFAEHIVTTSYLGSSTGLRRRGRAADRPVRAQRQDRRPDRVGLGRPADPGLLRRRRGRRCTPRPAPGSAGRGAGSTCPPAGTRRCCRRGRSPT